MADAVFTPMYGDATTTLADLGSAIPANEEWSVELIRVSNIDGTNDAAIDVAIVDPAGPTTVYLVKGFTVAAGTAGNVIGPDVMKLPTGWKFQHRASADGDLQTIVTGTKRSTV